MRFIIHGAGAVGSLIGGRLAESGRDVLLVARQPHIEAINRNGLRILDEHGERIVKNLPAVDAPSRIIPGYDDVIFLTVKTAQTPASVQALRERYSEETPVFCFQNGVRNEELASRRFKHVYGAMAGLSVTMLAPGKIAQTLSNRLGIGCYPFGCDRLADEVADYLSNAGFTVTRHRSIMDVKWSKLLLNLNNATYAIIDSYLQLGLVTPAIARFMAGVLREGLAVLESAGIDHHDPETPYDIPAHIAELESVIEDPEKIYLARRIPVELRTYPSTWMDLKQRRGETEASFFNGEIILLGEKHHLPTPYNTTLLQIVETMAAELAEPGKYMIEELADLVEQKRLKLYEA
ncbi:MAG: 2-dehydropantoate 2-reductase [Acidobacteriota bacterium]|nr:MAG: 2-dehydropantoate 2-reductase [Acidobacteriota bacterium]